MNPTKKVEYVLIASSGTLDGIRKMIRKYWFLDESHDPLKPTDGSKCWEVCTATKDCPNHRVIKKGSRYRFEFASIS